MDITNIITWENTMTVLRGLLDFVLVWAIIHYIFKIMRNNVRMLLLIKGVFFVIVIKFISDFLQLNTLLWIVDQVIQFGFLSVIILFAPEIRNALELLGRNQLFGHHKTLSIDDRQAMINEIKKACDTMSKQRVGALITIENEVSLSDYVNLAQKLEAAITSNLFITIFNPSTPLHDGAVIIQGNRISCAGAFFPTTSNKDVDSKFGTRHRAALGISEITDSTTIVVSEETGFISVTSDGSIFQNVSLDKLESILKSKIRVVTPKSPKGGKK